MRRSWHAFQKLRRNAILPTVLLAGLGHSLATSTGTLAQSVSLPPPFVHLRTIDPSIVQDVRYATSNNVLGRRIVGYDAAECILLRSVALALAEVQRDLAAQGYSLKVYDCYRPVRAVQALVAWARDGRDDPVSQRYHPRTARSQLIDRGYIARTSNHSLGSAVDVTFVRWNAPAAAPFDPAMPYGDCTTDIAERAPDSSIDMGTGYDCFDRRSHVGSREVTAQQRQARELLARVMSRHGFRSYAAEWWHFDLPSVEAGGRRFDFPIPPLAGRE